MSPSEIIAGFVMVITLTLAIAIVITDYRNNK